MKRLLVGMGLANPPFFKTECLCFHPHATGTRGPKAIHRPLAGWLILLVLMTTPGVANDSAEADHLLYLADQGPVVIRLLVEFDGRSPREVCREHLAALCQRADTDHDGLLSESEYQARVVTHPAIQEAIARLGPRPSMLTFGEQKVPLADVQRFLFHRIWPPVRMEIAGQRLNRINQTGVMQQRPIADTELFSRLDADDNHKLTGRELDRAAVVLGKLDFDEDESISLEELRMQMAPTTMRPPNANAGARRKDQGLSVLTTDGISFSDVRQILTRYDGEGKGSVKDQRLDRTEIRMAPAVFDSADADGDGFWDLDELWHFLEHPTASAEIRWQRSGDSSSTLMLSVIDDLTVHRIDERPNSLQFDIHGTRFQWSAPAQPRPAGVEPVAQAEFQAIDGDKNEYLEINELMPQTPDTENDPRKAIFAGMDSNGDGKVYFPEFLAYAQQRGSLRDSQVTFAVENLGRTLFGPLDLNSDGRLSPRELGQLKQRLPEWDTDGDGRLVEDEIPQQYRVILSFGSERENSMTSEARPALSADAPLWFRKMDRNRDGEVTAKEFLGTKPQFEKIDANTDGTIDAAEAARVK